MRSAARKQENRLHEPVLLEPDSGSFYFFEPVTYLNETLTLAR